MEKFNKLGLSSSILSSIEKLGFVEPTEIQEKSIPFVIKGDDVIASASTGSGKTLSFGAGLLQNCEKGKGIQGLVLAPTRELAEQISKELKKFSKESLKIVPVYGGVSIEPQIDQLERAEIVIGTPGRINDHLSRETLDLSRVKILVLDEADRMLDMGFKEDVERIIHACPKDRQTLLFSATISPDIALMAKRYMKEPVEVAADAYVDKSKLSQFFYDVPDHLKLSLLIHLLQNEDAKLVMVFCNTRRNVDFVANNLSKNNIDSLPIHGGFTQNKRNAIMEKFHSHTVRVLICTDVAARGLDIKGVSHVYNYDIPNDPKEYIHRIGRTARAGKEGKIINILASRDYENFRQVIEDDSLKINPLPLPELKKVWISLDRPPRGRYNDRGSRDNYGGRSRYNGRSGNSSSGRYRNSDDDSDNRRNDRRPSNNRSNRPRSNSYSPSRRY